ncbi:MAG: XRE family transcriptional regulator [Proteobacteria bacterium]|nr:XRE family transcriptional regulator [Pseudomonadota bacterium]
MNRLPPENATIRALRSAVALQLARFAMRLGTTQVAIAKRLGLPQPTVSKILNGHVSDISLELLIRAAARAGLPMTLQTGRVPQEAGAFVSSTASRSHRTSRSRLAEKAHDDLIRSMNGLTPTERLQAFVEHNQLMGALYEAGRNAEAHRLRTAAQKS